MSRDPFPFLNNARIVGRPGIPARRPVRRAFLAAEVLHLIHCLQLDFGVSHRSGRSAPGQSAVGSDHWGGTWDGIHGAGPASQRVQRR